MTQRTYRFLLFAGPLLLWIVVLFLSGSELARYETSWRLIQQALRFLCPEHAPPGDGTEIQVYVDMYQINESARRVAHIIAYAVFAMLTVRAIQAGKPRLKPEALSAALGLGIVFIGLDELHRHFQQVRHAKWNDVWLDLGGVTVTIVITILYFALKTAEQKAVLWETATPGDR
jgi:VanZ family protein